MESVQTVIVGAGQAGLSLSYALSRRGHAHVLLERGRVAERWRSERWDGLYFQTPNLLVGLPGLPFPHSDPDGYSTATQIADYLEAYAEFCAGPVRRGVNVERLTAGTSARFLLETSEGPLAAQNVVLATGPFQRPVTPSLLPASAPVQQLHAAAYRSPRQLPDGAVLVVGAGASGAQIADELLRAGRQVYLSVSRHRRAPRRYRGHDHVWWWIKTGLAQTPPEKLSPDQSPVVHSGAYGGHTIDFRDYAARGMTLLGRAESADESGMNFAADLAGNLAHGDAAYLGFLDFVDGHIERTGMDLSPDPVARRILETPPEMHTPLRRLEYRRDNIASVIWATGYALDFTWVDLPVFDANGEPCHVQGRSSVPGLYFIGLNLLSKLSSSFLLGVAEDAERLAGLIADDGTAEALRV